MKWLLASLFAMIALLGATPALAQATRTWVSGVGDDANPCSRTAPCKTFAGAISKTAAGGEINCLDPGGFGAVTITKSMTIDCIGTQGSILAAGTSGVIINGANIVVNLRNLSINGASTTVGSGIRILNAAAVNVDNVNIMNFTGTGTVGRGISIETAVAGVRVNVTNSSLYNMGNHGIHSVPTAGNVLLVVDNVDISRGSNAGIQLRQLTTASIDGSTISNHVNGAGIGLELTTAVATISNTLIASNAFGINHANAGGAPTSFIYGNVITRNTTAGLQISTGTITSLGNNLIRGNAGNEAPSSTIGTQ